MLEPQFYIPDQQAQQDAISTGLDLWVLEAYRYEDYTLVVWSFGENKPEGEYSTSEMLYRGDNLIKSGAGALWFNETAKTGTVWDRTGLVNDCEISDLVARELRSPENMLQI